MGLNEIMDRLKAEREAREAQEQVEAPAIVPVLPAPPLELPDEVPTMRDLATALYMTKQRPTCRNCLRRERGNCPSKNPMPRQCVSFQLNSRQMATYGEMATNVITAWREAIAIHAARVRYINERYNL